MSGPVGDGDAPGSLREYVTGFVLAVGLTALPFWLVMSHAFAASRTVAAVILGLAAVQIWVHMVYFLHMNTRTEGGWSLLALLFTLMLVVIALSGSLWVMYHLDDNMMPAMSGPHDDHATHDQHGVYEDHDAHDDRSVHHEHNVHDMHDMP